MTKKKVATKKVAKKVAPKKVAKTKNTGRDVNKVTLESYSMKMVIPTGDFANVQPEITVKAYSMDKAHDFIAPHMNKLWKEYYLINNRRPAPASVPVTPPAPTPVVTKTAPAPVAKKPAGTPASTSKPDDFKYLNDPKKNKEKILNEDEMMEAVGGKVIGGKAAQASKTPAVQPPASGVAMTKATQAIESCLSLDALDIIGAQVEKSTKLTHEDKEILQPLLTAKAEQLFDGK